jgi:hypothetical protein
MPGRYIEGATLLMSKRSMVALDLAQRGCEITTRLCHTDADGSREIIAGLTL